MKNITELLKLYEIVLGNAHAEPSDRCSYWRRSFHSKQFLEPGFSRHILSGQKLPKIPQGATVRGKHGGSKLLGCSVLEGWSTKYSADLLQCRPWCVPNTFTSQRFLSQRLLCIELRNSWKAETRLSARPIQSNSHMPKLPRKN